MKTINGFSKFTKNEKIQWVGENFLNQSFLIDKVSDFWMQNSEHQEQFEGLSENTISNYHLPFGIVPNILINKKSYCVPMVTEESSVVAAVSYMGKFWATRGGVRSRVLSHIKVGHIHFLYTNKKEILEKLFFNVKLSIENGISSMDSNMKLRGGGLKNIELIDCTNEKINYFQLKFSFDTCDAMGANYINSILEKAAEIFEREIKNNSNSDDLTIIMSILSNYNPDCLVEAVVESPINKLQSIDPATFVNKFKHAVEIANFNSDRAATHNKGIMNGVDAVVMATGNDFRAVEAGVHAYCCRNGKYQGLGECNIIDGNFIYKLVLPINIGTTGGVTSAHPLSKISLEILQGPSSKELMMIIASIGLLQNFASINALVTTGIQEGHMLLHKNNIMNQLEVTKNERRFLEKNINYNTLSVDLMKKKLSHYRETKKRGQI